MTICIRTLIFSGIGADARKRVGSQQIVDWDTSPRVILRVIKGALHADGGTMVVQLSPPNGHNRPKLDPCNPWSED
jgi:hypothetical protein